MPHFQNSLRRPYYAKYMILYLIEEILKGKPIIDTNGADLRINFINKIYDNEKEIFTSFQAISNSAFSTYENLFELLNSKNICRNTKALSG